jgi:hypothetical protein
VLSPNSGNDRNNFHIPSGQYCSCRRLIASGTGSEDSWRGPSVSQVAPHSPGASANSINGHVSNSSYFSVLIPDHQTSGYFRGSVRRRSCSSYLPSVLSDNDLTAKCSRSFVTCVIPGGKIPHPATWRRAPFGMLSLSLPSSRGKTSCKKSGNDGTGLRANSNHSQTGVLGDLGGRFQSILGEHGYDRSDTGTSVKWGSSLRDHGALFSHDETWNQLDLCDRPCGLSSRCIGRFVLFPMVGACCFRHPVGYSAERGDRNGLPSPFDSPRIHNSKVVGVLHRHMRYACAPRWADLLGRDPSNASQVHRQAGRSPLAA